MKVFLSHRGTSQRLSLLWGLFLQEQIPQVCPGRNFSWTHPVLFQSPRVLEISWVFWYRKCHSVFMASGHSGYPQLSLPDALEELDLLNTVYIDRPGHSIIAIQSLPGHQFLVPRFSAREIRHNQKGNLLLTSWEVSARFERFPS